MDKINVLYTFDTRFWRMAAVSINSLLTAHPTQQINVYCMVAPKTKGYRVIKKIVSRSGENLIWRVVRPHENPYNSYDYSRWSPVIFYRLFAHKIFPDIDRMLYLDSDTLVCKDLSDLFTLNLDGYALAAVRDMAPIPEYPDLPDACHVKDMLDKYLKHKLYINSGVLLLNLPEMKKHESDMLDVKIQLRYPDQDIINIALDGKIKELPLRYNCIPGTQISKKFDSEIIQDAVNNLTIAHFYAVKPYHWRLAPRAAYSMFAKAALNIHMYPDEFIKLENKYRKTKHVSKTHIPYLRIDKRMRIRLFGIRI